MFSLTIIQISDTAQIPTLDRAHVGAGSQPAIHALVLRQNPRKIRHTDHHSYLYPIINCIFFSCISLIADRFAPVRSCFGITYPHEFPRG